MFRVKVPACSTADYAATLPIALTPTNAIPVAMAILIRNRVMLLRMVAPIRLWHEAVPMRPALHPSGHRNV
jgi:hypothetical protein